MQHTVTLMGDTVISQLDFWFTLNSYCCFSWQILGRNVYPVSMLSYIPESPSRHPRVSAIKKEAEELLESSESQEESDPGPKHRKPKVLKLIATFLLEQFSIWCGKTKPKPITYQLNFSVNPKQQQNQNQNQNQFKESNCQITFHTICCNIINTYQ